MVGAGHAGTEHLTAWWPGSRKTTPACSPLSADCWAVPSEFRWITLEMPSHKHEEVYLAILQHTGNQDLSSHSSVCIFYHNSLTFIFIFSNYFTKYSYPSFWALGHSLHCYTQSKRLVYLTCFWHGTHLLSENLCQGRDSDSFFLIVPGFQIGKDSAPT